MEQFFGHSHSNYWLMYYDEQTLLRPLGMAYIPGSITTYSFLNPGYRIYEIDGNYAGSSWVCMLLSHLMWNSLNSKCMSANSNVSTRVRYRKSSLHETSQKLNVKLKQFLTEKLSKREGFQSGPSPIQMKLGM